MQATQSSSGMIFRQINNQNIPQNNHTKISVKKDSNYFRKTSQIPKVSKTDNNKENIGNELKQLQATGQSFVKYNKRQSSLKINYQKAHELTQQDQNNQITLVKVSLNENERVKETENLKNLFSHEPYIKQIIQLLPVNNYNISRIHRRHNLFSTSVRMQTSKNKQVLKQVKKNSCLGNEYEVISENLRQNILGRTKANFFGSRFDVYLKMEQLQEERLIGTIYYDDEFGLTKRTRSIQMYLVFEEGKKSLQHHETYEKDSLKTLYEQGDHRIIKLINKQPTMNSQSQYFIDFGIDGVLPSVKNVILIEEKTGKEAIKFYKVDQDDFQLKVCQNISIYLGYCFALSSLVFKFACQ